MAGQGWHHGAMSEAPVHVLVVEDDPTIAAHLVRGLKQRGFRVTLRGDGAGLGPLVLADEPDCVVLDLMLPSVDGLTGLQSIRKVSAVPVIVLTAKDALDDRLRSFEAGATDYVAKPYFIEELAARIAVRVGRRREAPRQVLAFGPLTLDLDAHAVQVGGHDAGLTRHEFDLLAYLARRSGRAVSRRTLVDATLSSYGEDRSDRIVDVHISRIRGKLGVAAAHLATVRGLGYRFDAEPRPVGAR